MQKIVESGLSIDFHIHSAYSYHKDGKKVAQNTIENIPILVKRINEADVNMCAITDHDTFNYDIYRELKSYEGKGSIKKVLPGVEFSVLYDNKITRKILHVIALFDDTNQEKIKRIEKILALKDEMPIYDLMDDKSFSESKFLDILTEIDVDILLIAHQKSSLLGRGRNKHDVSSLGKDTFNEFLFTEYFDALEYRNRRRELFNKIAQRNIDESENLRFVTGSDCHNFFRYPDIDKNTKQPFNFTYVKSLPTFKGLKMALTDFSRIKLVNSFFSNSTEYLKEINLTVRGQKIQIPLSRGINVIIGDNSIGKSLFIHKLTNYIKRRSSYLPDYLVSSYDRFLYENKITLNTTIKQLQIFEFDSQGEIKEKFQKYLLSSSQYFKNLFPSFINTFRYKQIIKDEFKKLVEVIKNNTMIYELEHSMRNLQIIKHDYNPTNITFVNPLMNDLDEISKINIAIEEMERIIFSAKNLFVDYSHAAELLDEYLKQKDEIIKKSKIVSLFNTALDSVREEIENISTDEQKEVEKEERFVDEITDCYSQLYLLKKKPNEFIVDIPTQTITPEVNFQYNYNFVTKVKPFQISNRYFFELLLRVFKVNTDLSFKGITIFDLKQIIKNYPEDNQFPLDYLVDKFEEIINDEFKIRNYIIIDGEDVSKEYSDGINSQVYFDVMSYQNAEGIYLVDQPEDNISQKAIKEILIPQFKKMALKRQVIMVTHNPQLVVNLDVDNVIYLAKENGKFNIYSGALEYYDENVNILELISENMDGGLATINKRWRRYDKEIND